MLVPNATYLQFDFSVVIREFENISGLKYQENLEMDFRGWGIFQHEQDFIYIYHHSIDVWSIESIKEEFYHPKTNTYKIPIGVMCNILIHLEILPDANIMIKE